MCASWLQLAKRKREVEDVVRRFLHDAIELKPGK